MFAFFFVPLFDLLCLVHVVVRRLEGVERGVSGLERVRGLEGVRELEGGE